MQSRRIRTDGFPTNSAGIAVFGHNLRRTDREHERRCGEAARRRTPSRAEHRRGTSDAGQRSQRADRGRRLPGTSLLVTTILPRAIAASALWAVPLWAARARARGTRKPRRRDGTALAERSARPGARKDCRNTVRFARHRRRRRGSRAASASTCIGARRTGRDRSPAGVLRRRRRASTARGCCWRSCAPTTRRSICSRIRDASPISGKPMPAFPARRYRILKDGAAKEFEATALRIADGGGLVVERDDGTIEPSISPTHGRCANSLCGRVPGAVRRPRRSAASYCRFRRPSSNSTSRSAR